MDRRVEIYNSALKLFVERGYDHTPMSHVASALGLSKAGLYHYFTSKEHLLFLIHEHYLKNHFIPIIKKAEEISDPKNRIAFFIREYTKLLSKDAAARVLIHEARRLKPEHYQNISQIWKRAFRLIRDATSEMEISGRSKKFNNAFAAFAAIGMCSWTFYWFDYSRKESAKELSETFVEIFLKGLLKDSEKL